MANEESQRIDEAVKMHFAARTTAFAPVSVRRAVRAVRTRLRDSEIADAVITEAVVKHALKMRIPVNFDGNADHQG